MKCLIIPCRMDPGLVHPARPVHQTIEHWRVSHDPENVCRRRPDRHDLPGRPRFGLGREHSPGCHQPVQRHPGSKANQAELKFKKERLYYEVEVVTPKNEVFDVKVDAKDGTVFQSKPDNHD